MNYCEKCGSTMPDHAKFCGKCGSEFRSTSSSPCRVCKNPIPAGDRFCSSCGFEMTVFEEKVPNENISPQIIPKYSYDPPQPQPNPPTAHPYVAPIPTIQGGSSCRYCHTIIPPNQQICPYCGTRNVRNGKDYAGTAGTILIITAILNSIIFGMAFGGSLLGDSDNTLQAMIVIGIIINIFAIWGGILAQRRKKLPLCILLAVLTIPGFMFFLNIIVIILLIMSKDAFEDEKKQSSFP